MKGLSGSRSHHAVTCDPSYDSMTLGHPDRRSYFLNPGDAHPGDHPCYTQRPNSFQSECSAYPDLASCTFPRRHYGSHHELKDECSGVGNNNNRIPSNLLEQFELQAPVRREGYHTLQYKRTAVEHQRSDSPGRIRHLVHSVQKLFTKSHSLEGPSGSAGGGPQQAQQEQRRSRSEPKMRSAISGYWSSDDTLDREVCLYHHHHHGAAAEPAHRRHDDGRHPEKSQSQYFMESYNTISAHSLKTSRSNNDVKCSTCSGSGGGLKKSSWSSTLTVSRAREVYQKASVNLDKALVKAEQGRTCHFLQVGPLLQLRPLQCRASCKPSDARLHLHAFCMSACISVAVCVYVCARCIHSIPLFTRRFSPSHHHAADFKIITSCCSDFVSICM
uniref:Discs, large (Drosophila) homolog-associated protein 1b n=1 Tax=Labrus bergylta TaxID=56723 RepID=A0A3Q3F3R5_9LABR